MSRGSSRSRVAPSIRPAELGFVDFLCEQALAACLLQCAVLNLVAGADQTKDRKGLLAICIGNIMRDGQLGLHITGLNKSQR
jgi:hypothetical protein